MINVANIKIEDDPKKGSWIKVTDREYGAEQTLAVTSEELSQIYFALKLHYDKNSKKDDAYGRAKRVKDSGEYLGRV